MRVLLVIILFLAVASEENVTAQQQRHLRNPGMLGQPDLDFFFESMTFDNHQWTFKLSANTRGMLWRKQTKDADVTGACGSGQILTVPESAICFEIKRKDLQLLFYGDPGKNLSQARLTLEPEKNLSKDEEVKWALIFWKPTPNGNRATFAYPED